jgi:Clp amino terminal domain, pathogenicity island component
VDLVDLAQLISNIESAADDPIARVEAAAAVKQQIEAVGDELLDHFVNGARQQGCSWTQIGEALGVTRQAAQQRHGGLFSRLVKGLKSRKFQRFTERARTAVIVAQTEARERNHDLIGTEHVLLGLVGDDATIAARALLRFGISRADIERLVDERAEPGPAPIRGHIPFTANSKRALELALREAIALGHNYIGTEHLLLGLRRTTDGLAGQFLAEHGVDYDELRAVVVDLVEASRTS